MARKDTSKQALSTGNGSAPPRKRTRARTKSPAAPAEPQPAIEAAQPQPEAAPLPVVETPEIGAGLESREAAAGVEMQPAWDPQAEHDAIARLAHSYWVERGCQGGSPEEDWFRAEQEIRRQRALGLK